MNKTALSVSQLNLFIKSLLDADNRLADVYVCGEISNFSGHYRSGHLYFTLKDANASVHAVMFSRSATKLRFEPENGMRVIIRGRVTVYERDGVYQIYAEEMQPDGAGALAVAFEQLKRRLQEQGYFDASHKKALPTFPYRIGVITSPTGAAVRDIFTIIERRWPLASVVLCPVSVQGAKAAGELVNAIHALEEKKCCDVIIIGRGGGSAEDLWAFNDEQLAKAIYNASTPIISGVGHETDFTICDFVSDRRAPTPSAAAELATPNREDLILKNQLLHNSLHSVLQRKLNEEKQRYRQLLFARNFSTPEHFFDTEKQHLDQLVLRLPEVFQKQLAAQAFRLKNTADKLDSLSPLKVLTRGYAVVYHDEQVLTGVKMCKKGDKVTVQMCDGNMHCTVEKVHMEEDG